MTIIEPDSIAVYLESLGSTPEQIAQSMLAKGIKGVPIHAGCCVLAVALEKRFGRPFSVGVWDVEQLDNFGQMTGVFVRVSEAVKEFTLNFDLGKYPYLEESDG